MSSWCCVNEKQCWGFFFLFLKASLTGHGRLILTEGEGDHKRHSTLICIKQASLISSAQQAQDFISHSNSLALNYRGKKYINAKFFVICFYQG